MLLSSSLIFFSPIGHYVLMTKVESCITNTSLFSV